MAAVVESDSNRHARPMTMEVGGEKGSEHIGNKLVTFRRESRHQEGKIWINSMTILYGSGDLCAWHSTTAEFTQNSEILVA